ncbi:MAG: hypothetical protein GEU96_15560 [Propionibacteriales bacterium]|nr:hypothetical protein [Propionibacteriales bacterium]
MLQTEVPPIVTDEDGDINIYPSADEAQRDMEAIDVRDGVYMVFDSKGNRLAVTTEGEAVRIEIDPTSSTDPDDLARRLRQFILRVGPERVGLADPENAGLQELVDSVAAFLGSK